MSIYVIGIGSGDNQMMTAQAIYAIEREGCESELCTLSELADKQVDMFTTVIIGNSSTKIMNHKLVTIRGYKHGK